VEEISLTRCGGDESLLGKRIMHRMLYKEEVKRLSVLISKSVTIERDYEEHWKRKDSCYV